MKKGITTIIWISLLGFALFYPSKSIFFLDGIPLNGTIEAVVLGLAFPLICWLHPQFLRQSRFQYIVLAIVALKIVTALALTQQGLGVRFIANPVTAQVGDEGVAGFQHSWDFVRTRFSGLDKTRWYNVQYSAIMDRPYLFTSQFPTLFVNRFHAPNQPPHANIRMEVEGFVTVKETGTLSLQASDALSLDGWVDNLRISSRDSSSHSVSLDPGQHALNLQIILTGDNWQWNPRWNGKNLFSSALVTVDAPSRLDRIFGTFSSWILPILILGLFIIWMIAFLQTFRPNAAFLVWVIGISCLMSLIGWVTYLLASNAFAITSESGFVYSYESGFIQSRWTRFFPLFLFPALIIPVCKKLQNLRGAFLLVGLPSLLYFITQSAYRIGHWSMYNRGDDWLQYQLQAYNIFSTGSWLEGAAPIRLSDDSLPTYHAFWYQPLYRYIVGIFHTIFGDSSIGEIYWDAIGIIILCLFCFYLVRTIAGFRWGLFASILCLATFTLSISWHIIGRSLSDISGAALATLAAFYILRARLGNIFYGLLAGVFAVLAFYTRLNHLPFLLSMCALILSMRVQSYQWTRVSSLLQHARVRVALMYLGVFGVGIFLFALRNWHYSNQFTILAGTTLEHHGGLSLSTIFNPVTWPPLIEHVLHVITVQRPPITLNIFRDPRGVFVFFGVVCALLSIMKVPYIRRLPLGPCLLCLGAVVFSALVVTDYSYPGRLSLHVIPIAVSLSVLVLFHLYKRMFHKKETEVSS